MTWRRTGTMVVCGRESRVRLFCRTAFFRFDFGGEFFLDGVENRLSILLTQLIEVVAVPLHLS